MLAMVVCSICTLIFTPIIKIEKLLANNGSPDRNRCRGVYYCTVKFAGGLEYNNALKEWQGAILKPSRNFMMKLTFREKVKVKGQTHDRDEYDEGQTRDRDTSWNARSLAEEPIVRLIIDGTVVRVRLDRKATSVSLLVVLGVREDGQKVLLAIKSMGGEITDTWPPVLDDPIMRIPAIVISRSRRW